MLCAAPWVSISGGAPGASSRKPSLHLVSIKLRDNHIPDEGGEFWQAPPACSSLCLALPNPPVMTQSNFQRVGAVANCFSGSANTTRGVTLKTAPPI